MKIKRSKREGGLELDLEDGTIEIFFIDVYADWLSRNPSIEAMRSDLASLKKGNADKNNIGITLKIVILEMTISRLESLKSDP